MANSILTRNTARRYLLLHGICLFLSVCLWIYAFVEAGWSVNLAAPTFVFIIFLGNVIFWNRKRKTLPAMHSRRHKMNDKEN